ncbi:MAG: hypothetical protein ACE366_20980 [Bradymonadia bacterium]
MRVKGLYCGVAALVSIGAMGCDALNSLSNGEEGFDPMPPTASLTSVLLVENPSQSELAAYYCDDLIGGGGLLGGACELAFGPAPVKESLRFSFDTVYGLGNPNTFPVPTVEILVALDVFEGDAKAALGTLCVSFCDPEEEDCVAPSAEQACQADGDARGLLDYEPTVEGFIELATDVIDGTFEDSFDNLKFRVIPERQLSDCRPEEDACAIQTADDGAQQICCDGACTPVPTECRVVFDEMGQLCQSCPGSLDAHVQFDLGIDAIVGILGQVADDAIDQLSSGNSPNFDIPYSVEGTLFFDVPVLGRLSLSFGPFNGVWSL